MQETIKIRTVTIADFKRLRQSEMAPPESGLFVIGGDNRQGKTTHLDAVAAAVGGEKFVPQDAVRDGAKRGEVTVELSNGLTVRRTFTRTGGGVLTVSDPSGPKSSPQQLLAKFVSPFALLPASATFSAAPRLD
jgi:recombinational DNA repair ATPase RecF